MPGKQKYKRGKGQILFRSLPGALLDFPDSNVVVKVDETLSEEITKPIKKRILKKIYDRLPANPLLLEQTKFPPAVDGKIDYDKFCLLDPREVYCSLYPLLFHDFTRSYYFESESQLETFIDRSEGSVKLTQDDLVIISKDGQLDTMRPFREMRDHKYRLIKMGYAETDRFWKDLDTGEVKPVGFSIGRDSSIAPARAARTFIPQILTIIGLQDLEEYDSEVELNFGSLVIAKYKGLVNENTNLSSTIKKLNQQSLGIPTEFRKALEKFSKAKNFELSEEDKKSFYQEASGLEEFEGPINKIKASFGESFIKSNYESIYDFLEITKNPKTMSISKLIQSEKNPARKSQYESFLKLANTAGIKEIYYSPHIPLIHVAYGFRRGALSKMDELKLMGFNSDKSKPTKTPIYAYEINTEGIILEFDQTQIHNWVGKRFPQEKNGAEDWFLKNMTQEDISVFDGIQTDGPRKEVFSLIHTMNHSLMKELPEQVGIGIESIGEVIFPQIPATLIYSHELGDFRIGVLKDLFLNKIYPWINRAVKSSTKCVYDPVCVHGNGSCHSCMFIPEISCAFFNNNLSRHYLLGASKPGSRFEGFWKEAKKELFYS